MEPGTTLRRDEESETLIDAGWQKLLATGFKPWPNDLKPTRFRFFGYREQPDGKIQVVLDPCVSYRDFIGAREPEFAERFDVAFQPRNLAVTTVLTAVNNAGVECLLITLRDKTQDVKPGGFHVSTAGVANIGKDPTPTATAYREALEECGATQEEVTDLSLRAFVFGPWTLHVEMVYFARLSISCEEVLRRKHAREDRVVFIQKDIGHITQLLIGALHAAVPVGAAALILFGEETLGGEAGREWRSRMETFVQGASTSYSALSGAERLVADTLAVEALKDLVQV